jgi:hypothetical protein
VGAARPAARRRWHERDHPGCHGRRCRAGLRLLRQ